MAQVAFTAPTDYAAQQAEIDRRRQMAELLMKQGLEQPQGGMVGQVYVGSHPLQHMAQALKGYFGAEGMKEADAQTRSLAQQQQAAYQSTLAEYMSAKTPNEKIAALLRNPMTAARGMQMQAKLDEPFSLREGERRYGPGGETAANPKPETFSMTPVRNAQGQTVTIGNQGGVRVLPEQGQVPEQAQIGPNGMVYRPSQLQPGQVFNKADDPFWLSQGGAGVVPNKPVQDFQIARANAGSTRVQNNVNSFVPASEEAQKEFMRGVRGRYDQLQSAPAVLENIESAKKLVPTAKGFMGSGANIKLDAAKFLNNNLGMSINPEGVKSAEELNSRLFMGVMENLKKMDAQPSQKQQELLQKGLGEIGTDPSALPRVLDVYRDIVRQKVDIHNREVRDASERGVKFPYNPEITLPAVSDGWSAKRLP